MILTVYIVTRQCGDPLLAFKGDTCGAFSRMRVCVLSLMLSYHILGARRARRVFFFSFFLRMSFFFHNFEHSFILREFSAVILQRKIVATWERVFDLDWIDPYQAPSKRRNRSIQGTIWFLRKEWLCTAHIFNRQSEIKRIHFC